MLKMTIQSILNHHLLQCLDRAPISNFSQSVNSLFLNGPVRMILHNLDQSRNAFAVRQLCDAIHRFLLNTHLRIIEDDSLQSIDGLF